MVDLNDPVTDAWLVTVDTKSYTCIVTIVIKHLIERYILLISKILLPL